MKRPSAKQLAARKRFAQIMRSGGFKKKRTFKSSNTKTDSNMARRKSSRRTVYKTKAVSRRSGTRSFLSGTSGKLLTGGIIGGVIPFVANRFAPGTAVLVDDASDLISTFIGGKWALVGNMIGKRVVPMLVRQGSGGNTSGDMA